jgi:hypothetical protein
MNHENFNIDFLKRVVDKEWSWMARLFSNGKIHYKYFRPPTVTIEVRSRNMKYVISRGDVFITNDATDYLYPLHGNGTLFFESGLVYVGSWCSNIFSGIGTIVYPDGIEYKGKWLCNMPQFDARHPDVKVFHYYYSCGDSENIRAVSRNNCVQIHYHASCLKG